MALKALRRFGMAENASERTILERCTVNITRYPIAYEGGGVL
jgi:hypothetical protein